MAWSGIKALILGAATCMLVTAAMAGPDHRSDDGAEACALYDRWHDLVGYDENCLRRAKRQNNQHRYERRTKYSDSILYADPYSYYCPVSANNGLGHMVMTFNGQGIVSDVHDMPFGGRPCTPQPPMRVLPGLN